MGDEPTLLLEVFHKIEKAGGQATLSVSTADGKTKVKLEIATTPAPPASTSTSSSTVRRPRRCSAPTRARRQRVAAHQAALAEAATSAPLDQPPHRPLCLLPSPPPESGRRQVMAMARPNIPSFSTLNVDGSSSPPPPPPPTPPTPTPPPPTPTPPSPRPSSLRPPLCYDNCGYHCEDCGRCDYLCVDHHGCYCIGDKFYQDEFICEVCNLEPCVRRQSFPT